MRFLLLEIRRELLFLFRFLIVHYYVNLFWNYIYALYMHYTKIYTKYSIKLQFPHKSFQSFIL